MQRIGHIQVVHFDRLKPFAAGTRASETGRAHEQRPCMVPQPEQLVETVDPDPLPVCENGQPPEEVPIVPDPPVLHAPDPPQAVSRYPSRIRRPPDRY